MSCKRFAKYGRVGSGVGGGNNANNSKNSGIWKLPARQSARAIRYDPVNTNLWAVIIVT